MRQHLLVTALGVACRVVPPAVDSGQEPDDLFLVSETATGRILVADVGTGRFRGETCLTEIHPQACNPEQGELAQPCLLFGFEHELIDGEDQILMTYTLRDVDRPFAPGAASLINLAHPPRVIWTLTQLRFPEALMALEGFTCADPDTADCHLYGPHNTIWGADDRLIIADTSNSRILWVRPPTDNETGQVEAILSPSHPDWGDERFVNQIQRIEHETGTWLLATFKARTDPTAGIVDEGRIVLWDITDPAQARRVWSYPETGILAAVHQGIVQDTPEGKLLLYAHSGGATRAGSERTDGSVGFARFEGQDPPVYLADGVLPTDPVFGFTREVEWDANANSLVVTDSGCENAGVGCTRDGRILTLNLPTLSEAGTSGAYTSDHEEQVFIDLAFGSESVDHPVKLPYDTDRIPLSDQGSALGGGLGPCP